MTRSLSGPLLDSSTGALTDPAGELTHDGYRPSPALRAVVLARDGRCRFPGCTAPARHLDLDHVRPWPTGPTSLDNLLTLCRRHHRIKQAPGWRVTLHADATSTWIDPTGRPRTSAPLEHSAGVLPAPIGPIDPIDPATAGSRPHSPCPDSQSVSVLEFRLEHHLTDHRARMRSGAGARLGARIGLGADDGPSARGRSWGDHPRYDTCPF